MALRFEPRATFGMLCAPHRAGPLRGWVSGPRADTVWSVHDDALIVWDVYAQEPMRRVALAAPPTGLFVDDHGAVLVGPEGLRAYDHDLSPRWTWSRTGVPRSLGRFDDGSLTAVTQDAGRFDAVRLARADGAVLGVRRDSRAWVGARAFGGEARITAAGALKVGDANSDDTLPLPRGVLATHLAAPEHGRWLAVAVTAPREAPAVWALNADRTLRWKHALVAPPRALVAPPSGRQLCVFDHGLLVLGAAAGAPTRLAVCEARGDFAVTAIASTPLTAYELTASDSALSVQRPTWRGWHGALALSHDGAFVAARDHTEALNVYNVNIASSAVSVACEGAGPHWVVFAPEPHRLWVCSGGRLRVIDPRDGGTLAERDLGPELRVFGPACFDPAMGLAWVLHDEPATPGLSRLVALDGASLETRWSVGVIGASPWFGLSSDSHSVCVLTEAMRVRRYARADGALRSESAVLAAPPRPQLLSSRSLTLVEHRAGWTLVSERGVYQVSPAGVCSPVASTAPPCVVALGGGLLAATPAPGAPLRLTPLDGPNLGDAVELALPGLVGALAVSADGTHVAAATSHAVMVYRRAP